LPSAASGCNLADPIRVDSSNPAGLDYAAHLRAAGRTIAEIVTKTGIPRTSLYRHLPPRPPEPVTAGELPAAAVS